MSSFGFSSAMMDSSGTNPMNTTVDVDILLKFAHRDVIALLQKCHGDKVLVWDKVLAGPMDLIIKYSELKEQGVVKMLYLEQAHIPSADLPDTVIFICRPLVPLMKMVANIVRNLERAKRRKRLHLFFLPRTNLLCTKWLQDHGVLGSFQSVEELPVYLFPLDRDVISLEHENVFKDFKLDMDPSGLYHVAKALVCIETTFGVPQKVFGLGEGARQVYDLMQSVKKEMGPLKPQTTWTNMDFLILIDREVDLLSPVVTQLTYEGLIDEFYGVQNNHVKFPEEKFGEAKTMTLNSSESLYCELRDKNFSAVGGILRSKTAEIQDILRQKDRGEMSVGEMKRLVQQLPTVNALKQSLSDHTSVAELIKSKTETEEFLSSLECEQELLSGLDTEKLNSHIEYLCAKNAPLNTVLRLLIIQNITSGGLKTKIMQYYERLIIQNYGFNQFTKLQRLYQLGLFRTQGNTTRYSVLKRTLQLSRNDVSETKPDDFTYVHSIYAPMSIRLVQYRLRTNLWTTLKESIKTLVQKPMIDLESDIPIITPGNLISIRRQPKFTIVVFIGGCTFAEISALRFLAQQDDDREFLVVTTKIINGNSFINSMVIDS